MSAASIKAIADRHLKTVDQECAAGRGRQVLERYVRDIGQDFAASTFMHMSSALEAATEETVDDLQAWGLRYPQFAMNCLAEGLRRGFVEQGFGGTPDAEQLEALAVQSFADRLEALFMAPVGGAA